MGLASQFLFFLFREKFLLRHQISHTQAARKMSYYIPFLVSRVGCASVDTFNNAPQDYASCLLSKNRNFLDIYTSLIRQYQVVDLGAFSFASATNKLVLLDQADKSLFFARPEAN